MVDSLRYDSYKPSNSPWLQKIPSHWKLLPGLAVLKENKDRNIGMIEKTVLSLSYGKVIIKPPEKLTGLVPESFETYQIINPNDIIIRPTDLQNDHSSLRTGLAKDRGIITSAYICLRPNSSHNPSFIHYLLHAFDLLKVYYGMGSGLRQNLDFRDFKRLELCIPSRDEQDRIANFLDQKTAEIDAAIAKKQRLIELLKEQKAILINQAVTKGLNPDVSMRDSGVEWIGEVPEHWILVSKMKFLSSLKGRQGWQGLKAGEYRDDGPYVLSSAHFDGSSIYWEKCPRVSMERYLMDESIQLQVGDVLLMKDGANMGKLAIVDSLPGLACLNSHLLLFRSLSDSQGKYYLPKYMFFHMMCDQFQDYVKVNGTGATFLGISQESIGNYPICLPTLGEQEEIVTYIEKEASLFDQAITLQQQQSNYLMEYRATIISNAVTGKIKL